MVLREKRETSVLYLPLGSGIPRRCVFQKEKRSESYTNTFIPTRLDRIGNGRHRKQGGGTRGYEHWIQHGLARIDVHMGLSSKIGTMGWHWDWVELWLLPMDWYILGLEEERMTGYTGLG